MRVPDAFPSIFDGQPSYMTKQLPPKRKEPSERNEEIQKRQKILTIHLQEEDKILQYEDIKLNLERKIKYIEKAYTFFQKTQFVFLKLMHVVKYPLSHILSKSVRI
jgi:hypothetical protein